VFEREKKRFRLILFRFWVLPLCNVCDEIVNHTTVSIGKIFVPDSSYPPGSLFVISPDKRMEGNQKEKKKKKKK
jgi:hypothetical protein